MSAQFAVLAELQNDTSTFTGDVVSTCSFSGLSSSYSLSNRTTSGDVPYLGSNAHSFDVTSNSAVQVSVQYSVLQEPAGYVSSDRWVSLRQRVDGRYQFPVYQRNTDQAMAPLLITETPGTAAVAVAMKVSPTTLPGAYSYQVTVTCLM